MEVNELMGDEELTGNSPSTGEEGRALFIQGVKQGLEEAEKGLGRPAEEVLAEMKAKYDF